MIAIVYPQFYGVGGIALDADVAHRGIGTGSCGPDVLDRYRIAPGTHRFTYRITSAVRPAR